MALVGAICIDRYEASRPDATSTWMGVDTSAPRSRAGVLPWMEASHDAASAACATVGKRLCAPDEWQAACQGPDGTVYPYGNTYEAATCNGIDTQCDCDPPYAGCYYACGGTYGPMATGSLAGCVNEYGLHDMSGNLWEHVEGSGSTALRGGAYNCGDSTSNHMCSFTPGWMPSALGFRCCLTPSA
jgi:formylglycine-generating enzyme required for sulfatase activity